MQYYRETGIYAERTAPWLERMGFENVKNILLNQEKQKELYLRIMEAKKAVENEPWEAIVENKEAQKSLKLRRCKNES